MKLQKMLKCVQCDIVREKECKSNDMYNILCRSAMMIFISIIGSIFGCSLCHMQSNVSVLEESFVSYDVFGLMARGDGDRLQIKSVGATIPGFHPD